MADLAELGRLSDPKVLGKDRPEARLREAISNLRFERGNCKTDRMTRTNGTERTKRRGALRRELKRFGEMAFVRVADCSEAIKRFHGLSKKARDG